jgi:hypothetical protein
MPAIILIFLKVEGRQRARRRPTANFMEFDLDQIVGEKIKVDGADAAAKRIKT